MNQITRRAGVLALILALAAWIPACSAQDKSKPSPAAGGSQVLATVNGQPITEADVRKASAEQFARLESEYKKNQHDLLEGQLNQLVQDRLLEAEAKTRNSTKEQVLASIAPAEVTDAEVDAFYEQNKAQIPRPKEQVAGQIKAYLSQQRQMETRSKFFDELQSKYKVEIKMEPMRADVAAIGPAKGPASAPVTIVEFSDFQCPYCARVVPTLDQVKAKYGDKVRIVFRQFPLGMHPQAQKAAEASLCANEQGKFWEMHDTMFQNQQQLAVDNLKAKASELGLNAEQFNSCLDSGKFAQQVAADMREGEAAGVSGTPAMFVNGRFINGAVPLEQISAVIDDELRRKGDNSSSK